MLPMIKTKHKTVDFSHHKKLWTNEKSFQKSIHFIWSADALKTLNFAYVRPLTYNKA